MAKHSVLLAATTVAVAASRVSGNFGIDVPVGNGFDAAPVTFNAAPAFNPSLWVIHPDSAGYYYNIEDNSLMEAQVYLTNVAKFNAANAVAPPPISVPFDTAPPHSVVSNVNFSTLAGNVASPAPVVGAIPAPLPGPPGVAATTPAAANAEVDQAALELAEEEAKGLLSVKNFFGKLNPFDNSEDGINDFGFSGVWDTVTGIYEKVRERQLDPCVFSCIPTGAWMGNYELGSACHVCLNNIKSPAQVPLDLLPDMITLTSKGLSAGFCGKTKKSLELHPQQGIDVISYPGGWMPLQSGLGYTGCEVTKDFPGLHTVTINGHAEAKRRLMALPKWTDDGTVWRGNELGLLIINENLFNKVVPRSILLGGTPDQHAVIRPILDQVYSCDGNCEQFIDQSLAMFFNEITNEFDTKNHPTAWVHQFLFAKTFGLVPNEFAAGKEGMIKFLKLQAFFTAAGVATQVLPDKIGDLVSIPVIKGLDEMFDHYYPLVRKMYSPMLEGKNCAPSVSCYHQLTSAIMDTLIGAGGLSVPMGLKNALWVLHGDTSAHPFERDLFPRGLKLADVDPAGFWMESLRISPPVVGVPYWTTPPARAYDDTASQTKDGVREIINVAMAQRDPNVWGANAHKFRIKDMAVYDQFNIGFADFAIDNTVRNGAQNRVCPGKSLSIKLGTAFFKAWKQDDWKWCKARGKYQDLTPYTDGTVLCKKDVTIDECDNDEYEEDKADVILSAFNSRDVAETLTYPNLQGVNADGTSVPAEFHGAWWMDGNPVPDYILTFGHMDWKDVKDGWECSATKLGNRENNAQIDCVGGMYAFPHDAGVWTWHNNMVGKIMHKLTKILRYKFDCGGQGGENGDSLTFCQIIPEFLIGPLTLTVPPSLVSFDMTLAKKDTWIRSSFFPGGNIHRYYLKRIINGDGSVVDHHWSAYNSNGQSHADNSNDIFGFGGDNRTRVSKVDATQYIGRYDY